MSPPAGHPAEAHQTSGLGRDAVGGDQLLLLAERAEKSERVGAEADDRDDREQHQRGDRACGHARSLAPSRRGEHDEREHQPG